MMGEDVYAHEEKQERLAEQKTLHRPMRSWYADARNGDLEAEYGPFPAFWQELDAWAGWRAVRKLYLRFQDTGVCSSEWLSEKKKTTSASGSRPSEPPPPPPSSSSSNGCGDEDAAMIRELYEPMRAWYERRAGLREKHGAFPSSAGALRTWTAFGDVTNAFLEDGDDHPAPRKRKRHRFTDATTRSRSNGEGNGGQLVVVRLAKKSVDPRSSSQAAANSLVLHQQAAGLAPGLSHEQRQELMLLQMRLRTVQERSMNFAVEFEKWNGDPNRPPSPPPIYGPDGKRANTAEVRFRQQLDRERSEILAAMGKIQPQAAAALGDAPKKPVRKLYIPIKEYPNVCFMGLILGPRGNHHKRMERETGCKIRIRGRGSLREGSRGKDAQRDMDDEKDDLHVYIEGPTDEAVRMATEMVEPLLNPESSAVDELKEKHQLELAEINGTIRADEYCHICGEKGHRQWECPAKQRTYAMANVRCALCGDTSHPTRDCALNKNGAAQAAESSSPLDANAQRVKVDSQFLDFMSELGEDPGLGFKPIHARGTVKVNVPAPTLQSVHPPPPANPASSVPETATAPAPSKPTTIHQRAITVTPKPIQFAPGQPSHTPPPAAAAVVQPAPQPQQPRVWFSPPAPGAPQWSAAAYPTYNPYQQYYGYYAQQQQQQQNYAQASALNPYMMMQQHAYAAAYRAPPRPSHGGS
ncbi:hypothetical protein CTAYLR_005208 [Chrysophaeum taylorii]|uniref:Branchpoint-bridging protein n=1 Tax=Chrysophaeum taylorii TaxID=2483200 RepID=A0AAD7UBL4_9STRA|nr:hypothetical protein CTAYLR_005208 [Chrysophaeum taylorii]